MDTNHSLGIATPSNSLFLKTFDSKQPLAKQCVFLYTYVEIKAQ